MKNTMHAATDAHGVPENFHGNAPHDAAMRQT